MNLIVIGRCFVFAYLLAILAALFPIRFADIAWQQQVIDTFVNAGSVPITGRVFILIALLFKGYDSARLTAVPSFYFFRLPSNGILAKRKISRVLKSIQRLISGFLGSVFVFGPSFLFLAVAVLQIVVSTSTFRALENASLGQVSALTQQTSQSRAALSGGTDPAVIERAVRALVPAPEQQQFNLLNSQQQRSELIKRLDDREDTLRSELDRQRTQRFTSIVWQTIKNVLVSLLFGYCLFCLRPSAIREFIDGVAE